MNAPLFVLATRPKHVFDPDKQTRVPADPVLGQRAQLERPCSRCGAVKITVLPSEGGGYRLWRLPGETAQRPDDPGCVSDEVVMGKVAGVTS